MDCDWINGEGGTFIEPDLRGVSRCRVRTDCFNEGSYFSSIKLTPGTLNDLMQLENENADTGFLKNKRCRSADRNKPRICIDHGIVRKAMPVSPFNCLYLSGRQIKLE